MIHLYKKKSKRASKVTTILPILLWVNLLWAHSLTQSQEASEVSVTVPIGGITCLSSFQVLEPSPHLGHLASTLPGSGCFHSAKTLSKTGRHQNPQYVTKNGTGPGMVRLGPASVRVLASVQGRVHNTVQVI